MPQTLGTHVLSYQKKATKAKEKRLFRMQARDFAGADTLALIIGQSSALLLPKISLLILLILQIISISSTI